MEVVLWDVLGCRECDCIGDGIGVVGVESELGSRRLGAEGEADTGAFDIW